MALPILAGPEIGVASTKAFTCQLAVLAGLAIAAGRQRGTLDAAERGAPGRGARHRARASSPSALRARAADRRDRPRARARAQDVLFLGRGPMYPLALEGALKLKEISYIHAEGYASGELKHGPIALVDEARAGDRARALGRPLRQDRLEHAGGHGPRRPGAARQRRRRASPQAGRRRLAHAGDARDCDPFVAPIVYAAPAQLLAYHAAILKGTDVDQPRNLAKSVTVE